MDIYKQCRLRKGSVYQTVWIPTQFAKRDKVLRLKRRGQWDNGWVVQNASSPPLPHDLVMNLREAYRNQRGVSDI